MSSYFPDVDPQTGLPKKKKQQQAVNQAWQNAGGQPAVTQSLLQNPLGTFGPSSQVDYGFGRQGAFRSPGMPDYRALIDNDAGYAQAKLDLGAQGVSDAASRAAMTQRALTLFGGPLPQFEQIPGLNQEFLNQDVTPITRQLAQANTDAGLSIAARQAKAFKDQVRQIKNALASRGALRSGEAGHQLQNAQLGYDQAKFDSSDELMQFIGGLQAGYAEKQRLEKQLLAKEAAQAEARVRESYPGEAVPSGGFGALPGSGPLPTAPQAPDPGPPAADNQALINSMIGSSPGASLAGVIPGYVPPKPGSAAYNQALINSMIGSLPGDTLDEVLSGIVRSNRPD